MGKIVVGDDGGMTTTSESVLHTRWPCVRHGPEISCEDAIKRAADSARIGKVYKPNAKAS